MDATKRLSLRAAAAGLAAVGFVLSAGAWAAPGHDHGDERATIGAPAQAGAAARVVRVTLSDMAFAPKTITVKQGETVRFVLVNHGELLHEFNIGTPAMHAEHRKEMAALMDRGAITATGIGGKGEPSTDSMTGSTMDHMDHSASSGGMTHDDPNTVLVAPGETKELVWTFGKATDLQYACNVPGHYESGMVGAIRFAP